MASNPSPSPAPYGQEVITYKEALGIGKQTARVYTPRIIHVLWKEQIHVLIGVASHMAWRILARKYKQIRLRGYDKFKEHKRLTGDLMRKWCWEIVAEQLGGS